MRVFENLKTGRTFLVLTAALFINAGMLFVVLPASSDILSPGRYSTEFVDLYDQIANNLVQGNGYRIYADMAETMVREPGYPLFLATVFKIGGYHIEAVRLANLLLVLGICFMMMRFARRVTGDGVIALIAVLMFLFHPGTLIAEARGGTEIAFIFALLVLMLALHHAVEKGELWRYFFAGSMLGLANLVRSTALMFPLFLLVYLAFIANGTSERLKVVFKTAVLVLGMVVVMLPWVIRNYVLVHEFVPTATVLGLATQEGQYTCKHFSFDRDFYELEIEAGHERNELARRLGIPFRDTYFQVFYDARDETVFNKILLQRAAMEYGSDPTLLARCVMRNLFFNFWFLGKTWRVTWLNVLIQVPFLLLALGGACSLWKRRLLRKMGIILTFVVYLPLVHAPVVAIARHSLSVLPFLTILASISLVSIWRAYRTQAPREAVYGP
jgi:4-amino-4-deoxy-L-arabinose transferase-like glycosyltransferase